MRKSLFSALLCLALLLCLPSAAAAAEAAGEAWLWPVEASRTINSGFGLRSAGVHRGLDIACAVGTPVRAAKSGVVLETCFAYGTEQFASDGAMGSYGNYVALRHPDGTFTLYAHLQQTQLVAVGDTVAQGDVIAYSGQSGNASGPHCHFQASADLSHGWSAPEALINTMPTEECIQRLGLTVVNPYTEAPGFSAERMTYIWSLPVGVSVGGAELEWTDAAPFIGEDGRAMVPLRAVGDALGLTVRWDAEAREAVFTDGEKTICFPIGSPFARTGDGGRVEMDTAAVIADGRTYAPVRCLAEYFGHAVAWDGATRTVLIS